jgi:hypothetical protein
VGWPRSAALHRHRLETETLKVKGSKVENGGYIG